MMQFNDRVIALLDSRAAIVLAFTLTVVWGFWFMPLYDVDEGAFTEATREMMESGNYISIYLNGEPRHDKPVLIYWLQAASAQLFGLNEFSLRLPSILASLGWVVALFMFARRHTDEKTARVATLLLLLSLYVGLVAKAAIADALLHLFLVLSMFEIYNYYCTPAKVRLMRIFMWMGLGFLTKGPIAVFVPFVTSGIFYLSYGRWREWLTLVFNPLGLLLFIAIVLPWHVAVYLDTGWAFFEGFYLQHNLDRYSDSMEGHGGSVFYYVLVAPLIVMPFAGWFIANLSQLKQLQQPLVRFIWIWFIIVLLLFSFSSTKLPHYLLYGMTGLFLLMAISRDQLQNRWLAFVPVVFFMALCVALPQLFAWLAANSDRELEQALFETGAGNLAGWPQLILLVTFLLMLVVMRLQASIWQRLLLIGFLQAVAVSVVITPVVLDTMQAGPKTAGLLAKEQGKKLVLYRVYQPSVSLYSEQVIRKEAAQPGEWAYVRIDRLDDYLESAPAGSRRVIFKQAPAALVETLDTQGGDK